MIKPGKNNQKKRIENAIEAFYRNKQKCLLHVCVKPYRRFSNLLNYKLCSLRTDNSFNIEAKNISFCKIRLDKRQFAQCNK